MTELTASVNQTFSAYARKVAGLKTRNISVENVKKFLKTKQDLSKKNMIYNQLPEIPSAIDQLKRISFALKRPSQWELELSQLDINGTHVKISGWILKEYLDQLKSNLTSMASDKIRSQVNNKNTENKEDANNKQTVSFRFSFQMKP